MNLLVLLLVLFLLFGGGYGWHSYGQPGGLYLGGGIGLILVIVLVLVLVGRI